MKRTPVFFGIGFVIFCLVACNMRYAPVDNHDDGGSASDSGFPDGGVRTCQKNQDCDVKTELCIEGKCKVYFQACSKGDECESKCCLNEKCVEARYCNPCTSNDDCRPDKICQDLECVSPGPCTNDNGCPVSLLCNTTTHKCECVDDSSCSGWRFASPVCDPVTKECREEKTCSDCDPACRYCYDGDCKLFKDKCCVDDDCQQQERAYCKIDVHECKIHPCSDPCTTDAQCLLWCYYGDFAYCDYSGACQKAECLTNSDCDAVCTTPGRNTCKSDHACECWTPKPICSQCTDDSECDDTQSPPQSCFTDPFNPNVRYCSHACNCAAGYPSCAKCYPASEGCQACTDTGRIVPQCYGSESFCACT